MPNIVLRGENAEMARISIVLTEHNDIAIARAQRIDPRASRRAKVIQHLSVGRDGVVADQIISWHSKFRRDNARETQTVDAALARAPLFSILNARPGSSGFDDFRSRRHQVNVDGDARIASDPGMKGKLRLFRMLLNLSRHVDGRLSQPG